MQHITKYNTLIPPPARWLCTIMGSRGRSASTCRMIRNKDAVFPPDRRMKSLKSNEGGGAIMMGGCWMSTGGCGDWDGDGGMSPSSSDSL